MEYSTESLQILKFPSRKNRRLRPNMLFKLFYLKQLTKQLETGQPPIFEV